jgi:alkylation response protein AidB-like acyl-CoA dehydrogenase
MAVGVARASFEIARDYAKEREAFGAPIATKQAIAFKLADMAIEIDSARMLAWEAAWRLDAGLEATEAAAGAFAEASEQGVFVGANAVQILGGHGFMQDYPVEKRMREARALGLLLGGLDAAREDAAAVITASDTPLLPLEGA